MASKLYLIITIILIHKSSNFIILSSFQGETTPHADNGTQSKFIESNTSLRSLLDHNRTWKGFEIINKIFVENSVWNVMNSLSGGDCISKVFYYLYIFEFACVQAKIIFTNLNFTPFTLFIQVKIKLLYQMEFSVDFKILTRV